MQIILNPELQANSILLSLIAAANAILETLFEHFPVPVTAEWDMTVNNNLRPILRLRLKNCGSGEASILVADFHDLRTLRERCRRAYEEFRDSVNAGRDRRADAVSVAILPAPAK
jgi:hypothetical protein